MICRPFNVYLHAAVFISRYDYQFLCHDAKGEGGGSPGLNVIMMLNSFLEVSPNTVLITINSFPVALTEL